MGTTIVASCGGDGDDDGGGGSGGARAGRGSSGDGGAISGTGGSAGDAGATFGGAGKGGAPPLGGSTSIGGDGSSGDTCVEQPELCVGGAGSVFECVPTRPAQHGYQQCRGGWLHRDRVATCPSSLPRDGAGGGGAGGGGAGGSDGSFAGLGGGSNCFSDDDCVDGAYGFCERHDMGFLTTQYCIYGCTTDADCQPNQICVCGDPVGQCAQAACVTDADCDDGLLCAGTPFIDPCDGKVSYAFRCQNPEDTCMSGADCGPPPFPGTVNNCTFEASGRKCDGGSVCGRPFLVGGRARLADGGAAARGWSAPLAPRLCAPEPARAASLAEHWRQLGLMEHASVAAFARFALELLALGAPAEFLSQTQRALGDEIAHAKLCFGLASAYAGAEIAPGTLSIDGALDSRSASEFVETLILEACLGETLAAAEAEAALEDTRDRTVRAVWARVAADEARHAELGWKVLAWWLGRAGAAERARALATLERAIADVAGEASSETAAGRGAALAAYGVLGDARRAEARKLALAEIVVPCAEALGARCARRAA